MKTNETKLKTEQLDKATEELRKVVDGVVSKLEYMEDTGIGRLVKGTDRLQDVVKELTEHWKSVDVEDSGIDKLWAVAEQLRELVGELVAQQLGKAEPQENIGSAGGKAEPWWPDVGTQAVEDLRAIVDRVRTNSAETKAILLGSIEALLAGADLLSWDFVVILHEARGTLSGGMQVDQLAEFVAEEAVKDAEDHIALAAEAEEEKREIQGGPALSFDDCADNVQQIENVMSGWPVDEQRVVLRYAFERLPKREQAQALEDAKDELRDKMLEYLLHNKSTSEQVEFYRNALDAMKAGNGIMEFNKASA